jgi:hypothetical protein
MSSIPIKDGNGAPLNFTPASDCIGLPSDSAAASDSGTFSLIALFKRYLAATTAFFGSASTSAKQDTGNTSLATIAGKDFATQTTLAAILAKIIAAPATEGGNLATIAGKDFATQTTLAALNAKLAALGQALMAASMPVVIASNQSAVPVSGTFWQGTQPVSIATAPVLVAGSAIIGKTGVDQTTDGTTNKVASAGLPTTAAINAASVGLATGLTVANIKASAGSVYGMAIANKTAATLYIQFYNTAGTPTLGTSVTWWVPVLASQQIFIPVGDIALANHATGIGIGASTTPTSTGTPGTAPDVVVFYK